MKPGRLLLALIFIIAILTTSSLAAIRTVSYSSSIPPNLVGTWTGNHTLDYFNPALGRLISVNFTVTLNATTSGTATNQAGSPVACASMLVTTDMDVAMINGDMLFLNVNLKIPSNGSCVTVPGHGSFSGSDNNSTVGYVFYSNPTDIDDYIGTGTFDLLGSFTGDSDISGGGSFSSSILTYGWSNSTITYTYNDALCLSGYKKDGCTGLPLSGWNITVRNSSWQRNATTNSSGFWAVCNLTPGSYWVNETTKSGWMNTTPASQSLLLGYLNRTVNFFNIPISNFTISKTAAPENPDPGENVTFTINVTNIGVASLSSVRVMDVLPVEMTYISSNPPGTLSDNIIVWENVGPIGPFSSTYLQVLMRSAE